MSDHHHHRRSSEQPAVSASRGALLTTLVHLWPYIWPADRPDLKLRVLGAMLLLLVAKLATIAVPFTFKWATDALAGQGGAASSDWLAWVVAAPIAMTIAYGGMRILMAALTQLRDGLFAKVSMHAVRRLAYRTFVHMHELSLRFHLERKTGGLTRVLERGRNAIETIVRMVIMQLVTTTTADTNSQSPKCPNGCQNTKVYRDGLRYSRDDSITQRWLSTHCGLRFSNKPLKSETALTNSRQIRAEGAKNLHVLPCRKHVDTGEVTEEQKALLKVFEGWLQKEGYNKNCYPNNVKTLLHLKANLMDPEDVKAKIAAHKVKSGMKMQLCYSYEAFLKMQGMKWERPRGYKQDEVTPFIPEETELDQLIAAAHSRQMAAYLQTLKETFADPGEALAIEWRDISSNIVNINHPVKDHKTGGLPVSNKLLAMLYILPHDSERVFSYRYSQVANAFKLLKRRIAARTKNERFNYIELRTFRHWGGTKLAEMSNGNVLTVMKFLRHGSSPQACTDQLSCPVELKARFRYAPF